MGLNGLVHIVETNVAGHRHCAGSVDKQFKEVVAAVDGQCAVQLAAPHVGSVDRCKEIITEVAFHYGLALGKALQVDLKLL